jgi:glycosidase
VWNGRPARLRLLGFVSVSNCGNGVLNGGFNHTSDQHPWFKEARSDPNSKYRDWYIWSDKKPTHANTGMVFFPGVQKSTGSYDKEARAWYFHRFYDFQPDLNTSNPHVQSEILKIMGFWIQLGVSGFRMDAVPFVIYTKAAVFYRMGYGQQDRQEWLPSTCEPSGKLSHSRQQASGRSALSRLL